MNEREEVRKNCAEHGIHWARAKIPELIQTKNSGRATFVAEWVGEQEARASAELEAKTLEFAQRNTLAAEQSAAAAVKSASAARASTWAAYIAAIIAFSAFAISGLAYMKSL